MYDIDACYFKNDKYKWNVRNLLKITETLIYYIVAYFGMKQCTYIWIPFLSEKCQDCWKILKPLENPKVSRKKLKNICILECRLVGNGLEGWVGYLRSW